MDIIAASAAFSSAVASARSGGRVRPKRSAEGSKGSEAHAHDAAASESAAVRAARVCAFGSDRLLYVSRYASEEANRRDALDRLIAMIDQAAQVPKHRVPTRPAKAARKRRTDQKTKRGQIKSLRRTPTERD